MALASLVAYSPLMTEDEDEGQKKSGHRFL